MSNWMIGLKKEERGRKIWEIKGEWPASLWRKRAGPLRYFLGLQGSFN